MWRSPSETAEKRVIMYFTVRTNRCGMADQLSQLTNLYALGTSLGYRYLHTPLSDSEHGVRGCLLDEFLGLSIGEELWGSAPEHVLNTVDVDLRRVASVLAAKGPLASVARLLRTAYPASPQTVLRFPFDSRCREPLQRVPKLTPLLFPFRDKYWAQRARQPVVSLFEDRPLKIAMHIRKGDTTFIPYRGRYIFQGKYFDSPGDRRYPHVEPCHYKAFVEALAERYGTTAFSTLLFSDGYEAAFRDLQRLGLCCEKDPELAQVKERCQRELAGLGLLPGVRLFVGGDFDDMCRCIHAFATCDVLIKNAGGFAWCCIKHFGHTAGAKMFDIHTQRNDAVAYCGELLRARHKPSMAEGR